MNFEEDELKDPEETDFAGTQSLVDEDADLFGDDDTEVADAPAIPDDEDDDESDIPLADTI